MLRKVLDSLDVIVSIDLDGNVRRMNDIYFRPIHTNQYSIAVNWYLMGQRLYPTPQEREAAAMHIR
jgi:hypothetical protein